MTKPAKRSDVKALLESKLKFAKPASSKHEALVLPLFMSRCLPLALPVNLQHGRDDVSKDIVDQIRRILGLSYNQFVESHQCNICASTLYLSFFVSQTRSQVEKLKRDPPAYALTFGEFCKSVNVASGELLRHFPVRKTTTNDLDLLVEKLKSLDEVVPVVDNLVRDLAPSALGHFHELRTKLSSISKHIQAA